MENIFIYTCKGIGYGNQTWFVPAINHFEKNNHFVYTNSIFLNQVFDVSLKGPDKPDRIYVPMWANWKKVFKLSLLYPTIPRYGFTYRFLGKPYSFGYNYAVQTDLNRSEHEQIQQLTGHDEPYLVKRREPTVKNRIVMATSNKPKNGWPYFHILKHYLLNDGFEVITLGEVGRWVNDLHDLRIELERAEYFIGVDGGIMHLADILDLKGLVLWGQTPDKNKPLHLKIIKDGLNLKPEKVYSCCQNLLFS